MYKQLSIPVYYFDISLNEAISKLEKKYSGISLAKNGEKWRVEIPMSHRIGHEAHFGQVTDRFLQYLVDGKLPDWEVPNMIAKYYITTSALEMAKNKQSQGSNYHRSWQSL